MALSKIELKLGKKVITLTPDQFEELKQDMRDLDRDHHYYWHNYQWPRWYYSTPYIGGTADVQFMTTTTHLVSSSDAAASADLLTANLNQLPIDDQKDPPSFSGTVLAVA